MGSMMDGGTLTVHAKFGTVCGDAVNQRSKLLKGSWRCHYAHLVRAYALSSCICYICITRASALF